MTLRKADNSISSSAMSKAASRRTRSRRRSGFRSGAFVASSTEYEAANQRHGYRQLRESSARVLGERHAASYHSWRLMEQVGHLKYNEQPENDRYCNENHPLLGEAQYARGRKLRVARATANPPDEPPTNRLQVLGRGER